MMGSWKSTKIEHYYFDKSAKTIEAAEYGEPDTYHTMPYICQDNESSDFHREGIIAKII